MNRALVLALAALAGGLSGCRTATQITIDVLTNVPCASWQGTAIAVGQLGPALETKPAATTSTYCDATGHLGSVVAVPSAAENGSVAFRVVGAVSQTLESCTENAGAGCIVARRALNFIPHEALSLSVPLVAACEGVACDPETTCVDGQCRPATIPDPSQCAGQTCGEGVLPPGDGGAPDATVADGGLPDGVAPDATVADGAGADGATPPPVEAGTFDAAFVGCGTRCALSLGQDFTCVVRDGGVTCWGQDYTGETGNNQGIAIAAPAPVLAAGGGNLGGVLGIASGEDTSCAYLAGGGISCWGAGSPLGSGGNDGVATLQAQYAGSSQVAVGNYHMCWVTPARQIVCQEAQPNGVEPATFDSDGGTSPAVVPPPAGYTAPFPVLATTAYFTCVLTPDGAVYCLGDNNFGNESNPAGGSSNVTAFTQVQLGAPALDLALMVSTGCARTAGHVLCWGDDSADETGGTVNGISEVRFADGGPLANAVQLAGGGFYHGCARLADGHVACWGRNFEHQLGRGEPVADDGGVTNLAALVVDADGGAFGGAAYVAAGAYFTCALKTDGSLWCWGDNESAQLGQGTGDTTPRSVPAYVGQ